jgi:hypothetical protein
MKLDQKYFAPFIGIGAVITMIFIVYTSFNFKAEQEENFRTNTQEFETLLTDPHPYLSLGDSLRLAELSGKRVIVLFWSSWSERSAEIMNEFDIFSANDQYEVVGAVVKDAAESAELLIPNHDFLYIDGTKLFNDLKVPGIPSYFVLDERGDFIESFVGYREGATQNVNQLF